MTSIPDQSPVLTPSDMIAYQLVVSKWGLAAITAGLSSLLEHDLEVTTEQRVALSAMIGEFKRLLGEDIVIEAEASEVEESPAELGSGIVDDFQDDLKKLSDV